MPRQRKNNSDYFHHKNNMRNDHRILHIRNKYGHEGYSVFNMLLEKICESEHLQLPFTPMDIEVLSKDFRVDPEKLMQIVMLASKFFLIKLEDGVITCKKINQDLNYVFEKRKNARRSAIPFSQKRENEYLETFEKCRKAFPGRKRGLETEFKYFKSKVEDWKKVLPVLLDRIEGYVHYINYEHNRGFQIQPKYFKSWILNRMWEQFEPQEKNIQKIPEGDFEEPVNRKRR